MNSSMPTSDRCLDLLSQQATLGLSFREQTELNRLLADAGQPADVSFELAAASLDLARLAPSELSGLPESLAAELTDAGRRWAADRTHLAGSIGFIAPGSTPRTSSMRSAWVPWALAASCALLAATSLLRSIPLSGRPQTTTVAAAPDVFKAEWGAWDNPEIPDVRGYVHWSDRLQRGIMHFSGLPANDPQQSQYQLWIIDERGLSQRINGAIFNSTANGDLDVEITPSIAVRNAAAFAVTIEQPGGTWVSDMSRRVVIAKKG